MKPGTVVAGRFEIERLAGRGGMGDVYRARDRDHDLVVALKLLRTPAAEDDRFVREVRALEALQHAAILRYIAHGVTAEGERYLVTEWLEGEDLAARLERGRLGLAEAVELASRVAEALAMAHARGIVHRDIKPSNLFLLGGETERIQVLDFGLARLSGTSLAPTMSGMLLGTPGYMAPEQARCDADVDARADVFALGCVLFECVTGRRAFSADHMMAVLAKVLLEDPPPLHELRPDVPPDLEALVAQMLAKAAADRPANGREVVERLRALVTLAAPAVAPPGDALTAGERRVLCVVLAAESEPTVLVDVPDVLELVRVSVESFGATANRLVDGSVLVTLSSNGAATDQVAQAARCALAMRALLPGYGLALATGRTVTAGRVPAGEAIDRAARLVRVARSPDSGPPAMPIRIDEASAGLLDVRFDVRAGDAGFVLAGEREIADSARQLLGRPSPTVGRDREIRTLEALFDECVEDQVARAAIVTAPAGTGKSRIRHEFIHGVQGREKPVVIWLGRGDPISSGSPFGMVAPAIRRAAGILDGEPLTLRQMKLRARLSRHLSGPDLVRVTGFLGELIGVPFSDEQNMELKAARQDARLMGDQMMRAWQDWLAAESAHQPVLIVLEDLHWGDPPTVSFTDAALRYLKDRPLMVLALARPEVHAVFPGLWAERGAQEIRLGELTRRASEKLVREVLGESVAPGTVERVVTLAAGNAFYLEELIRAVAEGKADALPETVLAMVEARLQSIEPEARRILRAASVFGASFWRGSVVALLGSSEGASMLDAWLAELAEREFISERPTSRFQGETEYQFRHDLVRAAAYAMLTEGDRSLGHRLAGEWLERMGETDAMALAGHFERGGEPGRALRWYRRAAEQALEGNDMPAAFERAACAIACGAEGETLGALRLVQAESCCWRGDFENGERHGKEALALLPHASPPWAHAVNFTQWSAHASGHAACTDELVAALLSLAPDQITPSALETMGHISMGQLLSGEVAAARRLLESAESYLPGLQPPDPRVQAGLEIMRAIFEMVEGESAPVDSFERGVEGLFQIGDLRRGVLNGINLAFLKTQIGGFREAEAQLRRYLEIAERLGLQSQTALANQNLALALIYQGRFEEAREVTQHDDPRLNSRRAEREMTCYRALIELRLGRGDAAERELRSLLTETADRDAIRTFALSLLSAALLAQSRSSEALDAAAEAKALMDSGIPLDNGESHCHVAYAEALAAAGRLQEAHDTVRIARDRLLARARKIPRPEWRESFLHEMPENARVMGLARTWLGAAGEADARV